MKYLIILLTTVYILSVVEKEPEATFIQESYDATKIDPVKLGPPNYQLYEYMKRHSTEYEVPFELALKCALEETGYKGKFHFTYTPFIDKLRRSFANAYGPLQVQVPTANEMWNDRKITANDLGYNIELNVITSFRYKRYLYSIYKDWVKVYSVYNQGWKGSSNINEYALKIAGNVSS